MVMEVLIDKKLPLSTLTAEVVGYAENAGLNAIVNIHHDGADSEYWLSIKDAAQDEI